MQYVKCPAETKRVPGKPSSETQEQLVGARKSLNGREIRAKKSQERPIFFLARLDFFPPPLTVPGSPRMLEIVWNVRIAANSRE